LFWVSAAAGPSGWAETDEEAAQDAAVGVVGAFDVQRTRFVMREASG
jgi:uncharacterized protein YbdZ (MbtH family)